MNQNEVQIITDSIKKKHLPYKSLDNMNNWLAIKKQSENSTSHRSRRN